MKPDLGFFSPYNYRFFKIWSHASLFHKKDWKFYLEGKSNLTVDAKGKQCIDNYVRVFHAKGLVIAGSCLFYNGVSSLEDSKPKTVCCPTSLHADQLITGCVKLCPESRFLQRLPAEASYSTRFDMIVIKYVKLFVPQLPWAFRRHRTGNFVGVLYIIAHVTYQSILAKIGFRINPSSRQSIAMSRILHHFRYSIIHKTQEAELVQLSGQSISSFSRFFLSAH